MRSFGFWAVLSALVVCLAAGYLTNAYAGFFDSLTKNPLTESLGIDIDLPATVDVAILKAAQKVLVSDVFVTSEMHFWKTEAGAKEVIQTKATKMVGKANIKLGIAGKAAAAKKASDKGKAQPGKAQAQKAENPKKDSGRKDKKDQKQASKGKADKNAKNAAPAGPPMTPCSSYRAPQPEARLLQPVKEGIAQYYQVGISEDLRAEYLKIQESDALLDNCWLDKGVANSFFENTAEDECLKDFAELVHQKQDVTGENFSLYARIYVTVINYDICGHGEPGRQAQPEAAQSCSKGGVSLASLTEAPKIQVTMQLVDAEGDLGAVAYQKTYTQRIKSPQAWDSTGSPKYLADLPQADQTSTMETATQMLTKAMDDFREILKKNDIPNKSTPDIKDADKQSGLGS